MKLREDQIREQNAEIQLAMKKAEEEGQMRLAMSKAMERARMMMED